MIEGGLVDDNYCVQSGVASPLRGGDSGVDSTTSDDAASIEEGSVDDTRAQSVDKLYIFGGDSRDDINSICYDLTTIKGEVDDDSCTQTGVALSLPAGASGWEEITNDDPTAIEGCLVDYDDAQSSVDLPMPGGNSGGDEDTVDDEPATIERGLVGDNCAPSGVALPLRDGVGVSGIGIITIENPLPLIEGYSIDNNGAQSGVNLCSLSDESENYGDSIDGDPTMIVANLVDDNGAQLGVALPPRDGDSGIDTITIEDSAVIEEGPSDDSGARGLIGDSGAQSIFGVTLPVRGSDSEMVGSDPYSLQLEKVFVDGKNEIERLSGQNGSLRAECEDMKGRLKVAEKKIADLETVLFANDMKLSKAERNLRIAEVKNDKLDADYGDAKAKAKELERARAKLAKSNADLVGELKALKANKGGAGDSNHLHEKLLQASEDVGYWKSKSNSYSKRLKTKRKKLLRHSKKIEAMRRVRDEHEQKLERMESTLAERKNAGERNERLRRELQCKLDDESDERKRLQREMRKCLEEKHELQGVLVQYDSKLDDMAELTKDLQSEEDEDCGSIEKWKKALFRINRLCGEYRNSFMEEKKKNDTLLKEIVELREKLRAGNSDDDDDRVFSYDSDQPCSSYSDDCNAEPRPSLKNLPAGPRSRVNGRLKKSSNFSRIPFPNSRKRRRRNKAPPCLGNSPYVPPLFTPEHRLPSDIPSIELRDSAGFSKSPDCLPVPTPTTVFPQPITPPPVIPTAGHQTGGLFGLEHLLTHAPETEFNPSHPGIHPGESLVTCHMRQYNASMNAIRKAEVLLKISGNFPEDSAQMRSLKIRLYREYDRLRNLESRLGGHLRDRFVPTRWLIDVLGLKW